MLSLIFASTIVSFVFIMARVIYSVISRVIIENFAFEGMKNADIKLSLKSQPFIKWFFMTFIWKCNPTGRARLGLATWFFIWHHISAAATSLSLFMLWDEFFFNQRIDIDFNISGLHVTLDNITTVLLFLMFAALPASIVVALPFILLSKKKRVDVLTPESTSEGNKVSERIIERDTTKMSRFDKIGYRVTDSIYSLPFRIFAAMDKKVPETDIDVTDTAKVELVQRKIRWWTIGIIIFLLLLIVVVVIVSNMEF